MDKELLERVSIGIKLIGYGLFIHSFFYVQVWNGNTLQVFLTNYQHLRQFGYLAFREGQPLYLIACIAIPIFIRWMLTGKFEILPFVIKED
tara:strand:+ start:1093 stop:1365 length:273 start_codon:yes stop_codon:yes gene_type:complete